MASPRIALSAFRNFRRVLPLMRDSRVAFGVKAATAVAALLIVSPLDIFGDIPVLGMFDDAVLLTLLAMLFVTVATWMIEKSAPPMRNVTPASGVLPRVPDRSGG